MTTPADDKDGHPAGRPGASGGDPSGGGEVPRLPRARHRRGLAYYFPPRHLLPIFALVIGLVAVLGLRDGCAQGVGQLFRAMEAPPDAGSGAARHELQLAPAPEAPPAEVRPMAPPAAPP